MKMDCLLRDKLVRTCHATKEEFNIACVDIASGDSEPDQETDPALNVRDALIRKVIIWI